MTPPSLKPPDQPGAESPKSDQTTSPPRVAGIAAASPAGSASVQATIAAYRSLRTVSAAIARAVEQIRPRPTRLMVIANESELEGLSEYRWFMHMARLYLDELLQLASEAEVAPEDVPLSASVTAGATALGDVISKVLVPLAPRFTFTDSALSIENATLVRVVAGTLAAQGLTVFTSLSLLLRQGSGSRSELADMLSELRDALRAAHGAAGVVPDTKRAAAAQRLTSIAEGVGKLTDSLTADPLVTQRLLKGAALDGLMSGALLLHVTIAAAAAQVHERGFLLLSSREHSGGAVATYAMYASDGVVRGGGVLDELETYSREERQRDQETKSGTPRQDR